MSSKFKKSLIVASAAGAIAATAPTISTDGFNIMVGIHSINAAGVDQAVSVASSTAAPASAASSSSDAGTNGNGNGGDGDGDGGSGTY